MSLLFTVNSLHQNLLHKIRFVRTLITTITHVLHKYIIKKGLEKCFLALYFKTKTNLIQYITVFTPTVQ